MATVPQGRMRALIIRFCASKIVICVSKLTHLLEFCASRITVSASKDARTRHGYNTAYRYSYLCVKDHLALEYASSVSLLLPIGAQFLHSKNSFF